MRSALQKLLIVCLLVLTACNASTPEGENDPPGTPQSLEFGYGIRIETNDPRMEEWLRLAAHDKRGLSWVALDFDWESVQPAPYAWNDETFSNALHLARSLGLETLVSVKNPPAWTLTAAGPDVEQTTKLTLELIRRSSPPSAIELFPAANTHAGWRASPNANAYAQLFKAVQSQMDAEGLETYLVAGGLHNALTSPEDVRDVDFLEQLYAAGLRPDILSIRLENLAGNPLDAPAPETLRHYEDIRAVMTANGHTDGLLWITGLSLPAGTQDKTWLGQACQMMQSQLYLGTVFYAGGLNDMDRVYPPNRADVR